jgi:hypothetical protein
MYVVTRVNLFLSFGGKESLLHPVLTYLLKERLIPHETYLNSTASVRLGGMSPFQQVLLQKKGTKRVWRLEGDCTSRKVRPSPLYYKVSRSEYITTTSKSIIRNLLSVLRGMNVSLHKLEDSAEHKWRTSTGNEACTTEPRQRLTTSFFFGATFLSFYYSL